MNEYDSVQPAYEEGGPKELNYKRGLPTSSQFGNGNKMVQEKNILNNIRNYRDNDRYNDRYNERHWEYR